MTLSARLDRFPPYIARLCARKGRGQQRKTIREIAHDGGLSKSLVAQMAVAISWKKFTVEQIERFTLGCGIDDLFVTKQHRRFLRAGKLSGVMRAKRERRYYRRLFSLAS